MNATPSPATEESRSAEARAEDASRLDEAPHSDGASRSDDVSQPDGAAHLDTTPLAPSRLPMLAAGLAAVGAGTLLFEASSLAQEATGGERGYEVYLLFAAAFELLCAVAIRFRRRWGLSAYAAFFPVHQLTLAIFAHLNPLGFALRLAVIVLGSFRLQSLR